MAEWRERGFTLLEMTIVLVVIGLVVGGILTGRELIFHADASKGASDTQKLRSNISVFRDKYGCLPGDCRNGRILFPNCAADNAGILDYCDGNNNGVYDSMCCNSEFKNAKEGVTRVWEHLSFAGLNMFPLSRPGSLTYDNDIVPGENVPTAPWIDNHHKNPKGGGGNNAPWLHAMYLAGQQAFGTICPWHISWNGCESYQTGMIWNMAQMSGNAIVITQLGLPTAGDVRIVPQAGIDGDFAEAIDKKIDDGKPLTGHMRAFYTGSAQPACSTGQSWPPDTTQNYRRAGNCTVLMDLGY